MATTRGLERLIFFTDAIAAIAITLLVLPLVELVPELTPDGGAIGELLDEHFGQLLAFVLSFAIIARLWFGHHQLFEHVAAYTPRLVLLTVLWAFTIVLLPLPTAITAQLSPTPGTVAFYIGTMAASSATLTGMAFLIRGDVRLEDPENPVTARTLIASATTTAAFVLALIVGTAFPVINYWALFLLFAFTPLQVALLRRHRRRTGD